MSLLILSCNKSDDPVAPYVVPYTIQYPVDIANIDKYLDEYHMDINSEKDATFTKLTLAPVGSLSIRTQYASNLHTKIVNSNGVDYKIYYLNITDTSNPNYYGSVGNPTKVDSVLVSYRGDFLYTKKEQKPGTDGTKEEHYNYFIASSEFEQAQNPVWFPLTNVIQGWSEIIPFFKTGSYDSTNVNGTVTYADFGAGVMFLPSGLAYYNAPPSQSTIPAYSPLIFTFKLKQLNYVDHDYDRIDSKDEDVNGDGDPTNDDSDLDGRANYIDTDDDGDGYTTKSEIKKPTPLGAGQGTSAYYPFSPILDNVLTPSIDESEPKGIPDASGNGVLTTRLRRHLDPNSKPPFTTY